MKKKTFLKSLSFTSLALLMGAAGVFAFAPLGTGAPLATANESEKTTYTTEQGLITPKADDPVIYTTESGLEIKWGNSLFTQQTMLGGGNEKNAYNKLTSGNLSGFPYFTTKSGTTTYTWVIIGTSTSGITSESTIYDKLSTWQSKTGESLTYKNFFENTYEATTPAGVAIKNNNTLNNYTARKITYTGLENIKTNSEIPSGCVLAYSNASVAEGNFGTSWIDSTIMYFSGANNPYRIALASYYTNDTFGFGSNKSLLQNTTVKQVSAYKTSSSSSSTASTYSTTSTSLYFFPLGTGGTTQSGTDITAVENFRWQTYLTASQVKITTTFWGRSQQYYAKHYATNSSGTVITVDGHNADDIFSYRPACVVKIF